MKKLYFIMVMVLFTASVHAQIFMPQELTCTEKALNFSFSVGSKWKVVTPKMGPLEASTYQSDDIPSLALKINNITPENHLMLLDKVTGTQQNYVPSFYIKSFEMPLPDMSFTPLFSYSQVQPRLTASLNRQFGF